MRENEAAGIDVVIPLYNKGAVIARAVGSVLRQTCSDWRLYIVDDGSTDGWNASWSDSRISSIRQSNSGPGAARNAGAALGEARLLAFLDADDEWEPDFLARMRAILQSNPEVGAASSSWSGPRADDSGTRLDHGGIGNGVWVWSPETSAAELKARVDSLHSSATVIRRRHFERFGGYYENSCTYGEDSYLWLAVALTLPIYRTTEQLLKFHTDASSLSVGRGNAYPLAPLLTDWARLQLNVGDRWNDCMRDYLAYYARFALTRSIAQGANEQVREFFRSDAPSRLGLSLTQRGALRLACAKARTVTTVRNYAKRLCS